MSMTDEEVIKALEKYKSRYTQCAADAEANEVIDRSIKALKCEPSTDAISRERLKECFHRNVLGGEAFDEIIDMQPPVTPERPKGEWVKGKDGYTRCTNCGSRGSAVKAHFCSHCGADMRGVSE